MPDDTMPTPDPKTNGRHDIFDEMTDEDFETMFGIATSHNRLVQEKFEHGLEAARVWR